MKTVKSFELKVHVIALSIAIFGPLINLFLKPYYIDLISRNYLYWAMMFFIYVGILIFFTRRSPVTLIRLILLGIVVEDFFSALWASLINGNPFLPFSNWYAQYVPFIGSLGDPTPIILIPRWYLVTLVLYLLITGFQYRKSLSKYIKSNRKRPI